MTITDIKQLPELLDLIHDLWFNVETVILDSATRFVNFRVTPNRSDLDKTSFPGITITVKNVEDLKIKDTERVRDYDVNEIKFDRETRTLKLTTGIPIEIIFRVTALEICVP